MSGRMIELKISLRVLDLRTSVGCWYCWCISELVPERIVFDSKAFGKACDAFGGSHMKPPVLSQLLCWKS